MSIVVAGISVVQGYVLAQSAIAVSCGADTTEDILATISIPAGALGINGSVRVTCQWTLTNNANSKTLRARFGGVAGTAVLNGNQASVANVVTTTMVSNRGAANSQSGNVVIVNSGAVSTIQTASSAVDTTAATTIVLSGQKASAGDTLRLESYLVELFPSA